MKQGIESLAEESSISILETAGIIRRIKAAEQSGIIPEDHKLLQEELAKRVNDFVVPEEYMAAARKYNDEIVSERVMANHERLANAWKDMADAEPLYRIALQFASAELPINADNREELTLIARKMVKKYLENEAARI